MYWEHMPGNEGLTEPKYTTLHNIKHLNPKVKIIIILRDPVERYKLYLSFHTIGTHRKNIFKKLNIRSSSELILYAIKKGIVKPQQH